MINTSATKVLHINNTDLAGRRFNGFDLIDDMQERGIASRQLVLTKTSKNPNVASLLISKALQTTQNRLCEYETENSYNNVVFPWANKISKHPWFKQADVVHYHLVHNFMVSIFDFAALTAVKPSVWTFHDPWPLTGHCIYPQECTNWKTGCHICPNLNRPFQMNTDRSYFHWAQKQKMIADSNATIVVASDYMKDMLQESPVWTPNLDIRLIPFGVDANLSNLDEANAAIVKSSAEKDKPFTVFFRCDHNEFKGANYIIEALERWAPSAPVTILTVGDRTLPEQLQNKYKVIQHPWTNDSDALSAIYKECDVFVAPSTAEAFGLMAVEAMSFGKPVVSFEGTSLPGITFAPDCGIAVPMKSVEGLVGALDFLLLNPKETSRRGLLGLQFVDKFYSSSCYLTQLSELYREKSASKVR